VRYLMIHWIDQAVLESPDIAAVERDALAWAQNMNERGVRLQGEPLESPREAATVRIRDGELLVSDGPFAETKEQIAGFDVIECDSMEEAVAIAATSPAGRIGAFELRQLSVG
jgi:hypothetical protein